MRAWQRFGLVTVGLLAVTLIAIWRLPRMMPKGDPLLSGPPQFVILSLTAALALYLRQVNLNAIDLQYKIRHHELWEHPPESLYREKKLQNLKHTCDSITLVSPFMFALLLVVCFRLVGDSYSRFYQLPHTPIERTYYVIDCLITVWLLVIFAGLTIVHFVIRVKDGRLQQRIMADYQAADLDGMAPVPKKTTPEGGRIFLINYGFGSINGDSKILDPGVCALDLLVSSRNLRGTPRGTTVAEALLRLRQPSTSHR